MSTPLIVIARVKAKPGQEEAVKTEISKLLTPTRAEEGCISYELNQSIHDNSEFMFYETWRSQADIEAHLQQSYIKETQEKVADLLAAPIEIHLLKKLD